MVARRRLVLLALAALLSAGSLVACEESAAPTSVEGLLILSGDDDGAIRAWFDPAGPGDPIATPGGAAWVSATSRDVLAVALDEGTLRTSEPIGPNAVAPDWDKPKALVMGEPAEGPFFFPTWDPEGGRLAVLAGEPGDASRLTLIDPSTDSAFEIELDRVVEAAPPAWLGPDVVVLTTGLDTPSRLIDVASGDMIDGPDGARLVASSADGALVAVVGEDRDGIVFRTTDSWLDEDSGDVIARMSALDGAVAPTAVAVDGPSQRVAVAWLQADGTTRIAVYGPDDGWRHGTDPGPALRGGASVAWLR